MKILATDVQYDDSTKSACAAGVMFSSWSSEKPDAIYLTTVEHVADYVPGEFYKRELPCLLTLLAEHSLKPDIIVIDGFVHLDGAGRPGLGSFLYEALNRGVVIIGVAKTPFAGIPDNWAVLRGSSTRPIYVTSEGIPLEDAKRAVASMHGQNRKPTLLTAVDHACRGWR